MTANPQGTVDSLDFTDVLERGDTSGPKASLYVPTDVTGTQADRSAKILKNQVKHATARFEELGMSSSAAESAFAPIAELIADSSYWRLQSRGLVVFVEPGYHRAVRGPDRRHRIGHCRRTVRRSTTCPSPGDQRQVLHPRLGQELTAPVRGGPQLHRRASASGPSPDPSTRSSATFPSNHCSFEPQAVARQPTMAKAGPVRPRPC